MLIGIIVSGVLEDYIQNLCKGIAFEASKDEDVYCVMIPGKYLNFDYEIGMGNKYGYCFNSLFSYGLLPCFDGLIVEMASVTMFADQSQKEKFSSYFDMVPHVFVSYEKKGYSSVSIDNKAGLNDALEYMYENGARKFAMLGGPLDNADAQERKTAFEDFIKKYDLPYPKEAYVDGDFFMDCSYEAKLLVEKNPDADVYVCANDILATRVYDACKEYGRQLGHDVSVLGFDDSTFATTIYPPLASIRTDVVELGMEAYKSLKDVMKGKPVKNLSIPSKFILRDSIIHRNKNDGKGMRSFAIEDVLKSNIHVEYETKLLVAKDAFERLLKFIDECDKYTEAEISDKLDKYIEAIFASDTLDSIDMDLFVNVFENICATKSKETDDRNYIRSITFLYSQLLKKLIKIVKVQSDTSEVMNYNKIYQSEAFFRETVQIGRSFEQNYARFLKNVGFMGIKNAYLYIYKEPVRYLQGEVFEIPETLLLKSMLKEETVSLIPVSKQEISRMDIFDNEYLDWSEARNMVMFPIYSDEYLYGITICDMAKKGFETAEIFVNQINAAVKMLELSMENSRVLNDYEESLRKLKENNIALATMSNSDPLTGLNNRRGFEARIERLSEYYPNEKEALMIGYVDMNDLKIVNDQYGHDEGDYSLKTIGNILMDYVTIFGGFAARMGGDEFVFAMPCARNGNKDEYVASLEELFEQFNASSPKKYNISVSTGVYIIEPGDNISVQDALTIADERMYQKKLNKKKEIAKE